MLEFRLGDLLNRNGVEAQLLTTTLQCRNEMCSQKSEMLRDRLARHPLVLAQLAQGLSVARMEPVTSAPRYGPCSLRQTLRLTKGRR